MYQRQVRTNVRSLLELPDGDVPAALIVIDNAS